MTDVDKASAYEAIQTAFTLSSSDNKKEVCLTSRVVFFGTSHAESLVS
jgi:hypothetical protein